MKEMIKNAAILFAITLIAGLLLGVVNDITKAPIALQKEQAAKEALVSVFENAASFEDVTVNEKKLQNALDAEGYAQERIDSVKKAVSASGEALGYVFTVTSKEGYAGEITFTMGVASDGTLNGICLTSINETVGLGMNAGKVLVPQFAGKKVEAFAFTKTGAMNDNEVDAISSATYTTTAIVNGVNAGLVAFRSIEEVAE